MQRRSSKSLSAHDDLHVHLGTLRCQRQNTALQRLAVHGHALDAMLHSGGIVHRDVIGRPTEAAGHSEAGQGVRDAGVPILFFYTIKNLGL